MSKGGGVFSGSREGVGRKGVRGFETEVEGIRGFLGSRNDSSGIARLEKLSEGVSRRGKSCDEGRGVCGWGCRSIWKGV